MLIIGICGPSSSGKSSIAEQLVTQLNANHFCLDDYYILGKKMYVKHKGKEYRTFERPELYDGQQLIQDLQELINSSTTKLPKLCFKTRSKTYTKIHKKQAIVLEGFLLYRYAELANLCTHKFFLDVPHDVIVQRRTQRMRGDDVAEKSFQAIGKSEWQQHGQLQAQIADVVTLDGTTPIDTNIQHILNKIKS